MFRLFLIIVILASFTATTFAQIPMHSPDECQALLNEPIDISSDFRNFSNTYYVADSLANFDPETGSGEIVYRRYEYVTRHAFNNMLGVLQPVEQNEFPAIEYEASPSLPFSVELVSSRTVRIRAVSRFQTQPDRESLMLVDGKVEQNRDDWTYEQVDDGHKYTSENGSVIISEYPWRVTIKDASGKVLTHTRHISDNRTTFTPVLPFSFVRRASDYSTSMAAVFQLSPDEKLYGCGESYTGFNKRGQKVVLYTDDANGTQNETMYKPIPFYMSSRGYGMFMHTSSPITVDFGKHFAEANTMMMGDDELDLFVFLGEPKDILDEYTEVTGKAPMPPLWSFGFWMSRITYFSEGDGRNVAMNLRKHEIPSDVIHFDTGWFETDWRCDYQFAESRFDEPEEMVSDLKGQGFHISLWQLPYFTPENTLFPEIIEKGLYVSDEKGNLPYEDAVLDFSNPETIDWYQVKLAGLLEMGVGAIKVDFGEAAPANGVYASGRTGFYEHNLYPLRYNKAASDITKEVTGDRIIWARSTWAGSQRYPVHWGGDPATTNSAMEATLRGGLSMGVSGFTFWSHDIGGFVTATPENLYRRWTPFGMLTSHVRSHGTPPTEPWEYSKDFLNMFRKADNMRYELMPYIYAQAKESSEYGWPMLRALFVEYPEDPGSWLVDDQYLFGSDMLVAPLFEDVDARDVYLPPGDWIDYQTGEQYSTGWHHIEAGELPIIMLVRDGAVLPHIELAQSTMEMDWSELQLVVFSSDDEDVQAKVCLPEQDLKTVWLSASKDGYTVSDDPFGGEVEWTVRRFD
ncbi:MAG: alpha-xylosidase [Candidatus Marinimicrobia bacterium]|nr:alpha-xylosidase [Candidatus Neomarinimicrobiota bacterium]MCF7827643.1 alpha-xylosidase [Candidatus Neomarinimicrobiota bacterium]MCF7881302.1 alpha-xylosidase [Candidatus Neomarinimicrobiota bacterium]